MASLKRPHRCPLGLRPSETDDTDYARHGRPASGGTTQILTPFNNTGTVEVEAGTLSLDSGGPGEHCGGEGRAKDMQPTGVEHVSSGGIAVSPTVSISRKEHRESRICRIEPVRQTVQQISCRHRRYLTRWWLRIRSSRWNIPAWARM